MPSNIGLRAHEGATVELASCCRLDRSKSSPPRCVAAVLAAEPESVALVTVMWSNNEVGTLQPIAELAAIAHDYGVPLHTDAVQAVGSVPVSFAESGVDALTLTGHKLGGPYGVGALLLRRDTAAVPLLHGGGQERDVRSGTLDVPGIVGFATATALAVQRRPGGQRFSSERATRSTCVTGTASSIAYSMSS